MVVDGQWTQLRKCRATRTLSPLCPLCGSEEGSSTRRHIRCSEVADVESSNTPGPVHSAAKSGSLWEHESFASRPLLPALKERPTGYTVPCETRWQGDRSLITAVICGDGSAYEGQDEDLYVAGWRLVATTGAGQSVSVSGTLTFLILDVDGAELFCPIMFLRIAHEQGVKQRGRKATKASTSAWADSWRDVWREIDAWEVEGAWATASQ